MTPPRPGRRGRYAPAIVAALLTLALTGCSDDSEPSKDSSPKSSPSVSPTQGTAGDGAASGVPSRIKVLDTGAEPRREVRLDLEKGHTETTTMDMVTTTTVDPGNQTISLPITLDFTSTVTDVTDDEIKIDSVYGKPKLGDTDLPPDAVASAEEGLAGIEGVILRGTYKPTGEIVSTDVELTDAAQSGPAGQFLQSLESQSAALSNPFPEEAVGVGAKWQLTTEVKVLGISSTLVATYEVVSLTDDGFELAVTGTQTVTPGAGPGGSEIIEGSTTITGTTVGTSGQLGPVKGTSSTSGTTKVKVGGQDAETRVDVEMDVVTR